MLLTLEHFLFNIFHCNNLLLNISSEKCPCLCRITDRINNNRTQQIDGVNNDKNLVGNCGFSGQSKNFINIFYLYFAIELFGSLYNLKK